MERIRMENSNPSVGTPFPFPPYRQSHLESETYRTLARILSRCYEAPQLCETSHSAPLQSLRPDHGSNALEQASGNEAHECCELVSPDGTKPIHILARNGNPKGSNFKDGGSNDTQMVVDEIDTMMRIEEDEEFTKQKEMMVDCLTEGAESQDRRSDQVQMLVYELEHIVKGNEEPGCNNNSNVSTSPKDKRQIFSGEFKLINNPDEHIKLTQDVMEESGNLGQLQIDEEHCRQNISDALDTSLDNCVISKGSISAQDSKIISLRETIVVEQNNELEQKNMEFEKLACASGTEDSLSHMIEDVEEGEIPGQFEASGNSDNRFLEDAVMLEEKNSKQKQVSKDISGREDLSYNEKYRANGKDSGLSSITVDAVDEESFVVETKRKESIRNEIVPGPPMVVLEDARIGKLVNHYENQKEGGGAGGDCSPADIPDELALRGEKLDESASEGQMITAKEKDAGVCNQKKRAPPSKEKKAKKKQRDRKKRAEKNRLLGVKRLKLKPVLKPKVVAHCRHYLKGRCHEGEKCKFSHDVIPLTKSMPCSYFARNSCMKGDDCPYDHQLSKYPCNNYASMGSCSRGKDCKFSHKLPLKEDSPLKIESSSNPNFCRPGFTPPFLMGNSISKKQLSTDGHSDQNINVLSSYAGDVTCKNIGQKVKSTQTLPQQTPKGIRFLAVGKSSTSGSNELRQGSSSPMNNEGVKARNATAISASGTAHNLNEFPKRNSPTVPPKGINFLSFGKSLLEDSGARKLANLTLNSNESVQSSSSNNVGAHKQACSSPCLVDSVNKGSLTNPTTSNMIQKLNAMLKKTQPAAAPQRPPFPSFDHYSLDVFKRKEQGSSSNPWKMPATPPTSGPSVDYLPHVSFKETPNSSQKALMSTLAFVAKFESDMKIDRSSFGALEVGNGGYKDNGTGTAASLGSQNDSVNC
ncbi:zinc finger CCCH domain-containing protein 65 isoform X3 [Tripterygium wilfordii]|uniref:zinc finger CCCH domain-containing protein 65 isoform X3 n=1 Tax=Tripterygium wilfordii TaxID=458696 RepID=UPI0018F85209|nr:zinc finger CCCH domain-containing protein 65 isoform X3 [Tripterygium wilfordii]